MKNIFALLVCILIIACSNYERIGSSDDELVVFAEDSLSAMVRVQSTGLVAILGTENVEAKANERPEMSVNFDYDFSMGSHEVTCGEFNALMKPLTGLSLVCTNDSIPVTNVTYYDAVLFANERSKAEKRDTTYTYSEAFFDAEKHCVNLEGFAYRSDVDAYRLPTEAEWIFVASRNWNLQNGWTADNSDYKLHKVCSIASEKNAICDMVGNAMEWVNDWLGPFRDTVVSNYVGAPDGGALGQRVVKGGSFRNTASTISQYSRGDVYMVTSSTRADYVGFRLAFGAIPNATWMGADGKEALSRIIPLASSGIIHSLMDTYKVKLAFRNDLTGNLAYIDYSNGVLSVTEIDDSLGVYHPEISPDGKKVAFCTGLEGVSGKSKLYVRDLNAEGSHLVKLDVESAAIPRWRVLANGDTVIVYVSDAGNNKNESNFKAASTWQVKFANGKFETPQKLFDGAYHGGISEDNQLAVTGARLFRARISEHEVVWYNGEQACNVSLARDSSKRTVFLDFGGKTGAEFVGKKYGTHEQLLIADSTGKLIQSVAAPSEYSFDHSEWVNGKNLAVATLANAYGAHSKIVLVNLSNDAIVELVEGDELWHPGLWVKKGALDEALLDLDSAGVYFVYNQENHLTSSSVELAMKLQSFWKKYHELECFALGSSMLMDAVIEDSVKSCKMLNMGITLADVRAFKYLFDQYIIPFASKTKVVVVELSPGLLFRSKADFIDVMLRYSPGLVYDEHHLNPDNCDFIAEVSQEYSYPKTLFSQTYMEGTFLLESVSWGDTYVAADNSIMYYSDYNVQENIQLFKDMKKIAEKRGLNLLLAITPRNPDYYTSTDSYGLFGPSREVAEQIIDELKKSGLLIFDENRYGKHDYTPEMAFNNSHVSYLGARHFTARLDSLLRTLK